MSKLTEALDVIENLTSPLAGSKSELNDLLYAFRDLVEWAEINYCIHEETYRGGVIWEICSSCGAKWADDEGGKPDDAHNYPREIIKARAILAKHDIGV